MAYSSIAKPTDYFNTVLYAGSNSDQSITGVGFQPDWVWIKNRSSTPDHMLNDVVRGAGKQINSNTSTAELDRTYFKSFDSDGFSLEGNVSDYNQNSSNFVGWSWLAGGSASSNGDGATTASVSVNTTSGISIASVAGNSTNFGHGLGVAPNVIIYKPTSASGSWGFACDPLGMTSGYLGLNSTGAFASGSGFIDGTSSTLVTVGSNIANVTNIYYMFAEKKGFSKFGSYTGGSDPFVYLGFKPAFVLFKNASATENWRIVDNKRDDDNPVVQHLYPNTSGAEGSGTSYSDFIDFLSNGFKIRSGSGEIDGSGNTIIYMAFAEAPFVANDSGTAVPVVAR